MRCCKLYTAHALPFGPIMYHFPPFRDSALRSWTRYRDSAKETSTNHSLPFTPASSAVFWPAQHFSKIETQRSAEHSTWNNNLEQFGTIWNNLKKRCAGDLVPGGTKYSHVGVIFDCSTLELRDYWRCNRFCELGIGERDGNKRPRCSQALENSGPILVEPMQFSL